MDSEARIIEEQNTLRRARLLGIEYLDTSKILNKQIFPNILTIDEITRYKIFPFKVDKYNITFGITTNTPQTLIRELSSRFSDQKLFYLLVSDTGYKEFLKIYNPPKKIEYQDITINSSDSTQIEAISRILLDVKPDDMLGYLVQQAFQVGASDIHIESQRQNTRIRLRIDGVMHEVATIPIDRSRLLLSSIASAADISISSNESQSGHINKDFKLATGEIVNVNLRVEGIKTIFGFDSVLRLFNFDEDMLNIDKLSMEQDEVNIFRDIIKHPTGLVLLVGPTGSGKTTTLYSLLNELNTPERKIITLEDPVEFNIPGIVQIPVNTDENPVAFTEKFKGVMRLDPDVIMVGEIRDNDTARTALQASLTGHLVLSTYHASSAAAAMIRLLEVINGNSLFLSSIKLISAQRLIRKLDPNCKVPIRIDQNMTIYLQSIVNTFPDGIPKPDIANTQFYEAGKSAENPFGYKGQLAIRELLIANLHLEEVISKNSLSLTSKEIEAMARRKGMLTMLQKGIIRACRGETSLSEVFRVVE